MQQIRSGWQSKLLSWVWNSSTCACLSTLPLPNDWHMERMEYWVSHNHQRTFPDWQREDPSNHWQPECLVCRWLDPSCFIKRRTDLWSCPAFNHGQVYRGDVCAWTLDSKVYCCILAIAFDHALHATSSAAAQVLLPLPFPLHFLPTPLTPSGIFSRCVSPDKIMRKMARTL